MAPMPAVLGHEFCAEVVEVGAEVRGFDIGDRTVGVIYPSCGRCEFCKRGDFTLCDMRELAVSERKRLLRTVHRRARAANVPGPATDTR